MLFKIQTNYETNWAERTKIPAGLVLDDAQGLFDIIRHTLTSALYLPVAYWVLFVCFCPTSRWTPPTEKTLVNHCHGVHTFICFSLRSILGPHSSIWLLKDLAYLLLRKAVPENQHTWCRPTETKNKLGLRRRLSFVVWFPGREPASSLVYLNTTLGYSLGLDI